MTIKRLASALFALLLLASVAITVPACNTVKGVGEDIQAVGEAGEEVITDDDDDGSYDEDDDDDDDGSYDDDDDDDDDD